MSNSKWIERAYETARQRYAELGVDTEQAIERLAKIAISIHCWQGDDVAVSAGQTYDKRLDFFKTALKYISVIYFIFGTIWIFLKEKKER